MAQEYISQVFEKMEGRVIKTLSKELSRTESRILGVLSKFDEFLLNQQVRICSVALPGTSRKSGSENREPTGNRSLGDLCPKAMFSTYQSGNLTDRYEKESHHMLTGVQEEVCYCPHMPTGAQGKIFHCSPGTSSGKQNKARSTIQPHFRGENTPVTTEADQILLVPQQLTTNTIQPIPTTTSTESRKYPNRSQQQCPPLTENQRKSNCLKISSKRGLKSTINLQKKTK